MKQGWEVKKLGDIAQISYGYTEKADYEQIGPKFLRITDIQDNSVDWNNVPHCKCNEIDLAKYKLETDDIVFARTGATTGKSYLIKNPPNSVFASYLIKLQLKDKSNFIPEYISYFFQTQAYWDEIKQGMSGSAQGGFNATKLGAIDIPIPSLLEQEKIVSILDKAFFAIDQAKQNAEKNLKNAKELFDSYLNGIFANKGDDWEDIPLKGIAEYFNGLTYSPKDVSDSGVLVLRSSNIQNDELDFNDNVYVNLTVKDKIKVKENDILMCSRNGSKRLVGKTAKIQGLEEEITFGTFMMIIRSDNHEVLSWFFKSLNFKEQISQGENTMINQITRYMLDEVVVSMPKNKDMQIKISNYLKILQLHTKKLENIYQQKITELEDLKKSILQKAFNGELYD